MHPADFFGDASGSLLNAAGNFGIERRAIGELPHHSHVIGQDFRVGTGGSHFGAHAGIVRQDERLSIRKEPLLPRQFPRLFIETKAITGCRLMDLATLESSQLRDGRITFRPDQTKGRKARSIQLPADLCAKLEALKGPKYLWESFPQGLIEAVKKMGCPVHRIKPDFQPKRLYHWIETLFIDYREANPDRPEIHSHQLRKWAFTAAWEDGIDPRKAAIAYGCNVDTVMKHYTALDEQAVTDEVTTRLASRLTPKGNSELHS